MMFSCQVQNLVSGIGVVVLFVGVRRISREVLQTDPRPMRW